MKSPYIGPILIFLLISTTFLLMATAGTISPSDSATRNLFAADIFKTITSGKSHENVIFSPASIQTCLALAYFGAGGQTAEELRTGLKLGAGEKSEIAKSYGEFLQSNFKSTQDDGPILKMANRIYVNESLKVVPEFNEIASKYFQSQAEQIRFADAVSAVDKINTWVEQETEHKIQNLLQPDAVDADTSSVLVNAIYFKARWDSPFSEFSTHKADFAVNAKQKVSVDMMNTDEKFRYAHLPNLDATALELPYKDSDLSMLIVLPNKVEGLADLEKKLSTVDLNEVTAKMRVEDVDVYLPKFKIEFDIDLKQPLQELGLSTMFSDKADFSNLFTTKTPQRISEVKHKAFLDVNEAGSEAAAATFMKIVPMSLNLEQKRFAADHPFVFAIRNKRAVYFSGHLVKP